MVGNLLREAVSSQCKVPPVYTVPSKATTFKAVLAFSSANLTSMCNIKKFNHSSIPALLFYSVLTQK